LVELKELFKAQNVKHFKIATLFFKPEAYKKTSRLMLESEFQINL
jgi:hypoxanthine phosphoribosyltransferase